VTPEGGQATSSLSPLVMVPERSSLAPGMQLGPYEVQQRLGAGGMGEVWRARDPRLQRDVAIKVIRPSLLVEPRAAARFDVEARAAAAVSHPNVRAIFDVGAADGQAYVVCELLDGENLRARIAGGVALPPRQAIDIARQIADGLAAAHASGVIHRDLKPENVFLTRDGQVKIVDFGLAKLSEPGSPAEATLTGAGALLGTIAYMAPEQLRGEVADARSDLFALGVMLHEMLSGTRPFAGGNNADLMAGVLREAAAPLPASVPPPLARVVERCLEKDRARRFQSARDLAFALEQAADLPSAPRVVAASRRRRPWLYATALVPLAAGAAAAVWTLWPSHPSPTFQRLSFRRGDVWSARFSPDGAIYYENTLYGRPGTETYRIRPGDPESRSLGIRGAGLLAVSPHGDLAVRLNPGARGRAAIGTLARVSPEGGTPRELAESVSNADWSPDGADLVVVRVGGGTDTVELPIGHPIYRTEGRIDDLRFSPDGGQIGFSENPYEIDKHASLVILDREGKVVRRSREYHDLYGVAWSPGGALWFTASDEGMNRSLRALTDDGDRELLRIPARLTLLDVARDGRVLLLRVGWRAQAMWRGPDDAHGERDLSWLDHSNVSDLSRDGTRLLLREMGDGGGPRHRTYLRDAAGGDAVWLGEGAAAAMDPAGDRVLIAHPDQPAALEVVPTGAGAPRRISAGALEARLDPCWFPDGKRIAYTGIDAGNTVRRVYVQDLDGEPRPLTPRGWVLPPSGACAVSPDGQQVVARPWGESGLFLWPVAGGEPAKVPGLLRHDRFAGWRGRELLVLHSAERYRVVAIDPTSGTRTDVLELDPAPDELVNVRDFRLAENGAYAYTRITHTSELYLVSGIE
jgi:serine/threonine protein kinase